MYAVLFILENKTRSDLRGRFPYAKPGSPDSNAQPYPPQPPDLAPGRQPRAQDAQVEAPVPQRTTAHKRPLGDAGASRSEDIQTNKRRTLHDTRPDRLRITLTLKSSEDHLAGIQAYRDHLRRQGLALTKAHLDRMTVATTHKQSREGATHKRP